jgi:hypothetical protein
MISDPHSHHAPDPSREGDPRHSPHLDTVAQKPTHIGAGARNTGPDPDAESDNRQPTPGAQPPEETIDATLRKPHLVAAGMPALLQSLKFTLRETGLTRGLRTWLKVNKKNGFDCQSCAWPNPDSHRHLFEFCENGVKALASEATLKHADLDFFREHSIADLQKQSDYWLERQGRIVHPMVKRENATHYEPIGWDEAFHLSFLPASSAPTTCPIARTCATSRAARRSMKPSASARDASRSTISRRPIASSSSARIRGPITRGC